MSTSAKIGYISENTPSQEVVVFYTFNSDFTEVTITDYIFTGVSDAKYPKFSNSIDFQAAFVNDEGVLVSAVGFEGSEVVLSLVTKQNEGEESGFAYLTTGGELKSVKPCTTTLGM